MCVFLCADLEMADADVNAETQVPLTKEQEKAEQRAKVMQSLPYNDVNNVLAYLDLNSKSKHIGSFTGIITFLRRSRIFKAISTPCTPYVSHQRIFWRNAVVDNREHPTVITSTVYGVEIEITAQILRDLLEFGDQFGDPTSLDPHKVRGLFARIFYKGEIKIGKLIKSGLCPQYKYLAHILQQCLSNRRSGHDELGKIIEHAYAALVLNHRFNFSAMIFSAMVDNVITKRDPFLMYPRFIQMIIDRKVPNLIKLESDELKLHHMDDVTLSRMKDYRTIPKEEQPREKRLIGHLANPDYKCPPGNRWRNDESDSDDDGGLVPPADADDSEEEIQEVPNPNPPAQSVSVSGTGISSTGLRDEDIEGSEKPKKKKKKRSTEEGGSSASWMDFVPKKQKKVKLNFSVKSSADTPTSSSIPAMSGALSHTVPSRAPIISKSVPTTPGGSSVDPKAPKSLSDEVAMLKDLLFENLHEFKKLDKIVKEQQKTIDAQAEQLKEKDLQIENLKKELKQELKDGFDTQKTMYLEASREHLMLKKKVDNLISFNNNLDVSGKYLSIKAAGKQSSAAATAKPIGNEVALPVESSSGESEGEESDSASSKPSGGC